MCLYVCAKGCHCHSLVLFLTRITLLLAGCGVRQKSTSTGTQLSRDCLGTIMSQSERLGWEWQERLAQVDDQIALA
jgi:hypothetical protein